MALKKVTFYIDDMDHARFRIQLKYDNLSQEGFYRMIMNDYANKHPDLLKYVYSRTTDKRTKPQMKKIEIDQKEEKQTVENFGLNEEEIKNIFDIIASEDPEL
jgi:hypothetical protein